MADTLPKSPLPEAGDLLTSTWCIGMVKKMEYQNAIAQLVSEGHEIHPLTIRTLKEGCRFTRMSLSRGRTAKDKAQKPLTQKRLRRIPHVLSSMPSKASRWSILLPT